MLPLPIFEVAMLLAFACSSPAADSASSQLVVEVVPSEAIPSVLIATWPGDASDPTPWARLETSDGQRAQVSATHIGQDWRAVLVGAPPETDVTVTVGSGSDSLATVATRTGDDSGAPWPDTMTGTPFDGYIALSMSDYSASDGTFYPLIIDGWGRPVWWHQPQDPGETFTTRVMQDADRTGLWFNAFHLVANYGDFEGTAGLRHVPFEGGDETFIELPTAHHDFVAHDDGSLTWTEADPGVAGDVEVEGDRLVTRSPDGTDTVVWSTWNRFVWQEPTTGPDSPWPILNHIAHDPNEDLFYVSLRTLGAIAAVEADGSGTRFVVGNDQADMQLADPLYAQHGLAVTDGGLLVFDNNDPGELSSRGLELVIDEQAGTVQTVWEAHADPASYTPFYGDILLLPDDSRVLLFGLEARLLRVSATGEVLQDITWDQHSAVGFGTHYSTLGQ